MTVSDSTTCEEGGEDALLVFGLFLSVVLAPLLVLSGLPCAGRAIKTGSNRKRVPIFSTVFGGNPFLDARFAAAGAAGMRSCLPFYAVDHPGCLAYMPKLAQKDSGPAAQYRALMLARWLRAMAAGSTTVLEKLVLFVEKEMDPQERSSLPPTGGASAPIGLGFGEVLSVLAPARGGLRKLLAGDRYAIAASAAKLQLLFPPGGGPLFDSRRKRESESAAVARLQRLLKDREAYFLVNSPNGKGYSILQKRKSRREAEARRKDRELEIAAAAEAAAAEPALQADAQAAAWMEEAMKASAALRHQDITDMWTECKDALAEASAAAAASSAAAAGSGAAVQRELHAAFYGQSRSHATAAGVWVGHLSKPVTRGFLFAYEAALASCSGVEGEVVGQLLPQVLSRMVQEVAMKALEMEGVLEEEAGGSSASAALHSLPIALLDFLPAARAGAGSGTWLASLSGHNFRDVAAFAGAVASTFPSPCTFSTMTAKWELEEAGSKRLLALSVTPSALHAGVIPLIVSQREKGTGGVAVLLTMGAPGAGLRASPEERALRALEQVSAEGSLVPLCLLPHVPCRPATLGEHENLVRAVRAQALLASGLPPALPAAGKVQWGAVSKTTTIKNGYGVGDVFRWNRKLDAAAGGELHLPSPSGDKAVLLHLYPTHAGRSAQALELQRRGVFVAAPADSVLTELHDLSIRDCLERIAGLTAQLFGGFLLKGLQAASQPPPPQHLFLLLLLLFLLLLFIIIFFF